MKAFLLHPERDFELTLELPPNHEALVEDLGLGDVVEAMAAGDRYLRDVAAKVLLAGLSDVEAIGHRQGVLADCIDHPETARQLYDLAVVATEAERDMWRIFTRDPDLALSMAVRSLERLLPTLRRIRVIADENVSVFRSAGFARFCVTVQDELDDAYLGQLEEHIRLLRFRGGVSINGRLGSHNAGTDLRLIRPAARSWQRLLRRDQRRSYTIHVNSRDDASHQALADMRARGVNDVANAVSQSVDHIVSFFAMVRFEIGFYLGCLNLRARLGAIGEPMCVPEPKPVASAKLLAQGLVDIGLSLRTGQPSVGNDLKAHGKSLVFVTGANQGGKSTFLRATGIAQIMMQAGMFVGARRFSADVRQSVFTHFKRREDPTMTSGKLDEELRRFSEIVDRAPANAFMLFNESFAATNEREGADIAEAIVQALMEAGAKVVFVTHSYELARRFFVQDDPRILFLRAERLDDGRRTFRQLEGPPLSTSYGPDLFSRVFTPTDGVAT